MYLYNSSNSPWGICQNPVSDYQAKVSQILIEYVGLRYFGEYLFLVSICILSRKGLKMKETIKNFRTEKGKNAEQKLAAQAETEKTGISNSKKGDSFGKTIFGNNILCAQFLRKYTNIDQLQNVQPEDIEDVSNRFTHMFTEEREADVIKKIRIANNEMPFYLISLIEHKSNVDYNVVMQILRYMVYIWEDYEKRENGKRKGISKTKNFKYPPVLPIIFYDGVKNWTAPLRLKERIYLNDIFAEYIPDYECMLIPIHKYSNHEIAEGNDELSILMLLDKLKDLVDFEKLNEEVSSEFWTKVMERTPEEVMSTMLSVVRVLLAKFKLPEDEIDDFVRKIKEEDNVGGWFEHLKAIDVPAERELLREEREEFNKEKEEFNKEKEEFSKEKEELNKVKEELHEREVAIYINAFKEMEMPKEKVVERVGIKFSLGSEKAEFIVEKYW